MEKSFLLPGEMGFFKEETQISTVLGSCVAVCLFDTRLKIGGMNHFQLPDVQGTLTGGKIGTTAIKALLREAMIAGCKQSDLVASIYGGAHVVNAFSSGQDIGERNILKAKEMLMDFKIPIIKSDVSGNASRRITMNTSNNRVEIVHVTPTVDENAQKRTQLQSLKKIRVLVVDDSSMVRRIVIKAIQKSTDLEVCGEAEDPYQANEMIQELDPDVICLDIMMPKMNGLEFLKRIMYYKPIPTVILSTLVQEGNKLQQDLKKAGALGFINKDDMKIYANEDNLQTVLIPKLRLAAKTLVYKIDTRGI